jgi:methionine salvage enolase-phosphatase E1
MANLTAWASWSGGNGRLGNQLAAHDPQRPREAQPVRVQISVQGGLVHQRADGVVDQQVGVHLLDDALGVLERSTARGPRWWVLSSSSTPSSSQR